MQRRSIIAPEQAKYSQALVWLEEVERRHSLLTLEIAGVRIWQIIRARIFDHVLKSREVVLERESRSFALGERIAMRLRAILRDPSTVMPIGGSLERLTAGLLEPLTRLQSRRLLRKPESAAVLVSRFNRLINGHYSLTAEIEARADCIILTKPRFANSLRDRSILIGDIERAAKRLQIDRREQDGLAQVDELARILHSEFALEEDAANAMLRAEIKKFLRTERFLAGLLAQISPETVHLCWNAIYFPLVSAAKKAGIRTIEYQHGTITAYHCHYSYREAPPMPYLPDEIRFFGPVWHEQAHIPAGVDCVDAGAPHLRKLLDDHTTVPRQENLVLVVSQTVVGLHLFQFTVEVARLRCDLEFVFKLHPAERYQDLASYVDAMPSNLRIMPGGGDTYRLMAQASYQMGVSSTTLVEGFAFGNRTVVVALASCEYMENEIERGHATLAQTPKEAASLLSEATPLCDDVSLYFSNLAK